MQLNVSKIFGERLSSIRKSKGYTRERLAFENDIAKSTVGRIERGLVDVKLSTLYKIAKGLGIPLRELVDI